MTALNLLLNVAILSFLWIIWGMYLFPRVYPLTHDDLMRKLQTQTLQRGESRNALRICALLPLVFLVHYVTIVLGRTWRTRVTNFVGLRILKLPE